MPATIHAVKINEKPSSSFHQTGFILYRKIAIYITSAILKVSIGALESKDAKVTRNIRDTKNDILSVKLEEFFIGLIYN